MKVFAAALLFVIPIAAQPRPPRQLVHSVEAEYSPDAREARLQGTVILMLEVTPEGAVAGARVKRGLGMGLDEQAVAAAMKWTYAADPGASGNQVVPAEVAFVLDPRGAWQIAGARFTVDTLHLPARQIVKPELTQYIPPDALACSGLHSLVTVNFTVTSDGSAKEPQAVAAAPQDAGVTTAVEKAVERWMFKPASADGRPRPATAAILMECSGTGTQDSAAVPAMRAGNGVTPPSLIYKVEPDYSEAARQAKVQGQITLSLVVEADGKPSNIRVTRGLGMDLDEEAMAALMQWRFAPGTKNGEPVRVMAQVNVNFRLL